MPTCTRKIIFTIKWIEGLTVFNLLMGTNTAARDYNKAEWWLVDWPLMGGLLWYTGPRWVGCYIWYSKEDPERVGTPPRIFFTVPNVTAHPLRAQSYIL